MGSQREEAASFLKDVDILERSLDKNGNLSYKRASELLTNIGEEAFKKYPPGTKIPTDQKKLQDIYFTLRDSMYESSAHSLGPEAANELAMNNQIISDFLKEKGRVSKLFESGMSKEKIRDLALKGDVDQLNAIKEILSPEDFTKFKGVFVDHLVQRTKDGAPAYGRTKTFMAKRKEAMSMILQPEEVKAFAEVVNLGDRIGTHVFNPPNSGNVVRFSAKEFMGNIFAGGADELTLETLKNRARNGAAIEVPFTKGGATGSSTGAAGKSSAKYSIPLLSSTRTQATETARLSSIQERNKEAEKRKRAISSTKGK
jgi:hypothetical protein